MSLVRTLVSGLATAAVGATLLLGAAPANAEARLGSSNSAPVPEFRAEVPKVKKVSYCTGIEKNSGVKAAQVIEVKQRSKTKADIYLCKKSGKRYVREAGALKANIGYNGMTAKKKEGDGKTPKGTFWMRDGFGTSKNPGLKNHSWTKVTRDHVWVDGKASKKQGYNTMQRKSKGYRGESLYNTTAYKYAQVIGYNEARTPGKGSAIFLHKHTKSGKTAGCVSLSEKDLVKTLKWQKSSKVQMVLH